jgi:hypothetical protein
MHELKKYRYEIALIFGIFAVVLTGALFSPSFSEQMRFVELFMLLGSVLFIFSILVIVALLGFQSFALYLALFVAIVMVFVGVEAALVAVVATYMIWGFIFSIELLLVDNGVESAVEWFKERYDFKSFHVEYRCFLPIMYLLHFFVETLPGWIYQERASHFSPKAALDKMREVLK